MSRKDYELIAKVLSRFTDKHSKAWLVMEMARFLGDANATFRADIFIEKCGDTSD
jgi:hypothetical protein